MDSYTTHQSRMIDSIDRSVASLEQVNSLSDEDYAQCLEVFEANSDQRSGLLNWLQAQVLSKMSKSSSSILSVGCGTGAFDEQILQYLSARTEHVEYLGIEPNDLEAAEFLKRMRAQNCEKMRVDASVWVEKFGDRAFDKGFDLILFVQSIYYLGDRNSAIDTALKALNPGGVLIIVVAPDESLNIIANLIWQRQMGQKSWFSDDMRNHFEDRGIAYNETRISANLNATDCFNSTSQDGKNIIDFIVQTRTDRLPDILQQDISEFLLSIADTDDNKTSLPHPVDIFRCTSGIEGAGV